MPNRREFLKTTAAAGGAVLAGGVPSLALAGERTRRGPNAAPLNILVLGGTGFIGPHLVRHAVSRGHSVTIFTRGRHDAELPAGVTRLQGDRNGKLEALEGKTWDAVVDDSATNPDWVRQSTTLLKEAAHNYLFTSSTGVYYPYLTRRIDESTPVRYEVKDPKDGSETYGVAKAQCERATQQAFGDRAIIVRPTYIVGPGDTTDRFPYWPQRLARGGEVLAPGRHDDPVQFIDVRDLVELMVHLLEQKRGGVYNAVGPRTPLTADAFYRAAVKALEANVRLTYVDDYDFLAAHKIDEAIPWAMLRGNDDGMMSVRNDRAIAAGLGVSAVGGDGARYTGVVADGARGTPAQAALHDHPRTGDAGAERLACAGAERGAKLNADRRQLSLQIRAALGEKYRPKEAIHGQRAFNPRRDLRWFRRLGTGACPRGAAAMGQTHSPDGRIRPNSCCVDGRPASVSGRIARGCRDWRRSSCCYSRAVTCGNARPTRVPSSSRSSCGSSRPRLPWQQSAQLPSRSAAPAS